MAAVRSQSWALDALSLFESRLGVILDYEVRSLGELWRLESLDEPRCHEDDAFM